MPFMLNPKNFEAVVRAHLREGETLMSFGGAPRKVIAALPQAVYLLPPQKLTSCLLCAVARNGAGRRPETGFQPSPFGQTSGGRV
jgi:hypothetical protein